VSHRDPHSYTDLSQGRVQSMDIDLAVDFSNRTITGKADFNLARATSGPLDLDTRDLNILSARDTAGTDLNFEVADVDAVLGSRLRVTLPEGTEKFTIEFTTSPEASALQWLEPAQTAGGKHPYLFSQCQAIHARSVMPCQDTPMSRFTFNCSMTVPKDLTVVMAAAPGEKTASAQPGMTTYNFAMPQSIPPYLFAFAVGNITARELGPRSTCYTEPEMMEKSAWEFAEVDRMLLAAEDIFGPYLWDRFDFLVMPPSFPYGGMENPRLTFLTPTLLAGDRSLVNVLAHELAHSWTGNLVTNASINDFWLNEGFTVWAERRILENMEGVEAKSLSAAIGRNGLMEAMNNFGKGSEFTKLEINGEGSDPDEFYSLVPYEKGFLFVALLEETVGREKMDIFVKKYIDHFAFTSLTTAQFEEFLNAELPGVAEQMGAEQWIHQPDLPANAPVFASARLEMLEGLAKSWSDGTRPEVADAAKWSPEDWQIFLQALPGKLMTEDCAWLNDNFKLNDQGNSEILCNWLQIAINSSFEPAYDRAASFLSEVGRMKYLKPLFNALHSNENTKELAARVFADNADSYHPIARGGLERVLAG
jgi:leukotriene-A4 hydrolase